MTFNLRLALIAFSFFSRPHELTKHKIAVKLDSSLANIDFTNEPLEAVVANKNRLATRLFRLLPGAIFGMVLNSVKGGSCGKNADFCVEPIEVKYCLICSIAAAVKTALSIPFFLNTYDFVLQTHTAFFLLFSSVRYSNACTEKEKINKKIDASLRQ